MMDWSKIHADASKNHAIASPATGDFDPRYLADCLSVRSLMRYEKDAEV